MAQLPGAEVGQVPLSAPSKESKDEQASAADRVSHPPPWVA